MKPRLEDIGFYTLSNARAAQSSACSPLYRCELLLTRRCNFRCPYCRGIAGDDIRLEDARRVLSHWFAHGLKNIRFSGGEPTLYPHLSDLVSLCRDNSVERVAVSTNGSAPFPTYKSLHSAGVNDFSISLDACCASDGDTMAGVSGSWGRVVDNIRRLSELTYVTVGIVYNELNRGRIVDVVEFAHDLGVSDIRIIPSAQYGNSMTGVGELIRPEVRAAHPILDYRVSGHRRIRGLGEHDCGRCRLVLDDMAVWNNHHYPCIIYLREGGKPIGDVSKDMRDARAAWCAHHNSHDDRICRENCLDVCVDYNNHADQYRPDEFGGV